MNKVAAVMSGMVLLLAPGAMAGEKAPQKVFDLAQSTLAPLGTDALIVKTVLTKNTTGETLEKVKELDAKWKETPGVADYMQAMLDNECSKHLRELVGSSPYYSEIFVMDQQGANVCMTEKTSDYWQGDEDKFQKSFNNGNGAVFVDDVKFDESTQVYLSQVSVPVKDGDKVIGAITFGIEIDKIQ